jgi:hypothetical protein
MACQGRSDLARFTQGGGGGGGGSEIRLHILQAADTCPYVAREDLSQKGDNLCIFGGRVYGHKGAIIGRRPRRLMPSQEWSGVK